MPRILRIINRFNLGGPTHNVGYLTKYMAPEFETLLIGGEHEKGEGSSLHILESMGLQPTLIPELKRELNWREDFKALRKLRSIIHEFKPDIVHTHASKAGAIGRLAASMEKVPVIVHTFHGHVFHSYFGRLKTNLYLQTERFLAKKTNAIIAISEKQKAELTEKYNVCNKEKVKVIPLGFDLQRFSENIEEKRNEFRNTYGINEDEVVLMIIGRLTPIKNHELFLDLIHSIKMENKIKVRGIIVGDGESKETLKNYAIGKKLNLQLNERNMESDVIFTSWIFETDKAIAGSDIVCITSHNEGTPVSLIEAQAGGRPVISTNVGGVSDIVEPGFGWVSPPGNLETMKNNLYQLLSEMNTIKEIKNLVSFKISEKFHYSTLVRNTAQLYRNLLNQTTQ